MSPPGLVAHVAYPRYPYTISSCSRASILSSPRCSTWFHRAHSGLAVFLAYG